MAHTRPDSDTQYSEQNVLNDSYDKDFNVLAVEMLGYNGTAMERMPSGSLATKITESGDYTYIAVAAAGTEESEAKWQVIRLDASSGLRGLYADRDSNFDNIATDLTALSYS